MIIVKEMFVKPLMKADLAEMLETQTFPLTCDADYILLLVIVGKKHQKPHWII